MQKRTKNSATLWEWARNGGTLIKANAETLLDGRERGGENVKTGRKAPDILA